MNAAPCSCLVVINFIPEDIMESTSSTVSSPGIPKIYLTSSVSRHFANKSDERIAVLHSWTHFLFAIISEKCPCVKFLLNHPWQDRREFKISGLLCKIYGQRPVPFMKIKFIFILIFLRYKL